MKFKLLIMMVLKNVKIKIISKKFSEKVPNGIGLSHYIFLKKYLTSY